MSRALVAIATEARAEARRVFHDPGALLILAGAVALYSFFYPIPYRAQVLREVPVAVVDHDRSALSRQLIRMADAHPLLAVAERPETESGAEALVLAGRTGGYLVVPEGFEREVLLQRPAKVGVFADASYFLVYRQVATGFLEATGTLSAGIEIRRLQARGLTEAAALERREPVPLRVRPLFNPVEGYASYVVPAVLVLILQQTLLIGIGLVGGTAAEAGQPASNAPPLTRLAGRASFYLALYSLYAALMFTVVFRFYGFPERSRGLDLALFALPFLLACIFLALALSRLFHHRETALQVLLFTSLPSVFMAGFAWPAEAIPDGLRALSLLVPSTSGIAGVLRLTEMGAELRHVRHELLVLWALTLVYGVLAWRAEARQARSPRAA
ncbi:MAG: ABC transporter permease [Vicinamibacteria bacterium]|nr:ABC transporter permease [Vicinamibacteria bacterium]